MCVGMPCICASYLHCIYISQHMRLFISSLDLIYLLHTPLSILKTKVMRTDCNLGFESIKSRFTMTEIIVDLTVLILNYPLTITQITSFIQDTLLVIFMGVEIIFFVHKQVGGIYLDVSEITEFHSVIIEKYLIFPDSHTPQLVQQSFLTNPQSLKKVYKKNENVTKKCAFLLGRWLS